MAIYVLRAFGGTLILGPSTPTVTPTTTMVATARDGKITATTRDGRAIATTHDGRVTATTRDGKVASVTRNGIVTTRSH